MPPGRLGHTLVTQGCSMQPARLVREQSHQLKSPASSLSHAQTHPGRCPRPPEPDPPQGICSGGGAQRRGGPSQGRPGHARVQLAEAGAAPREA